MLNQRKHVPFVLSTLITFMVLSFNNCGSFKSGQATSTKEEVQNDPLPPVEQPPQIAPGNQITPSLLSGFVVATGVPTEMNEYLVASGFKSIAVSTDNGLVFAYNHPRQMGDFQSQAEASQAAVERCNIITHRPCAVLGEGSVFIIGQSSISSSAQTLITLPTAFDASKIPGLNNAAKTNAVEYLSWGGPKAITVSVNGVYAIGQGVNPTEARRISLEFCQATSGGYPCFFYAENTTNSPTVSILFNPASISLSTPLPPPNAVISSGNNIPFLTDANRATLYTNYSNNLSAFSAAVLVVSDSGYFTYARSSSDTAEALTAQLMSQCQNAVSQQIANAKQVSPNFRVVERYRCYPFASLDKVSWKLSDLK